MAETKQYLDYDGLIRFVELVQTTFPTKQITAEALDQINQRLTELIDSYNNHSHTIEEQNLDISYSNNKLVINSIHVHQSDAPSEEYQVETPLPLPEGLRPNGGGSTIDYSKEYFTLHALGDGNLTLYKPSSYTTAPSYSVNGGDWTTFTSDTTLSLKSDDKVKVKCVTGAYQRSSSSTMFSCACEYEVYGNAMSLLYGDNFEEQSVLTASYSFRALFYNQSNLKNAKNLILPTAALTDTCYHAMFRGCTSLTTAPELPATTLENGCYGYMFYGCTSLTEAPQLPATKVANNCYYAMFRGCTSLTTAPELPTITLVSGCYYQMFSGCSKLNKITMLATKVSAGMCLTNWVYDVASSGIFIKNTNMTSLPSGASGIPSGWIVQNA